MGHSESCGDQKMTGKKYCDFSTTRSKVTSCCSDLFRRYDDGASRQVALQGPFSRDFRISFAEYISSSL